MSSKKSKGTSNKMTGKIQLKLQETQVITINKEKYSLLTWILENV